MKRLLRFLLAFSLVNAIGQSGLLGQTVGTPTVTRTDTSGSGRASVVWPAAYDSSRVKVTVCAQVRTAGVNKAEVCRTKTEPWVRHVVAPPPPPPVPPPPPPPPVNAAPVARPVASCSSFTCTFDGRGSSDDKGVVSFAWYPAAAATTPVNSTSLFSQTLAGNPDGSPRSRTWYLVVKDVEGLSGRDSVTFVVPGATQPPPTVLAVKLCPDSVAVLPGDTLRFRATVVMSAAGATTSVTYGASVGTIDQSGLWRAPTTASTGFVWAEAGGVRSRRNSCAP